MEGLAVEEFPPPAYVDGEAPDRRPRADAPPPPTNEAADAERDREPPTEEPTTEEPTPSRRRRPADADADPDAEPTDAV